MPAWEPVYLETHRRGLLQAKIDAAYEILSSAAISVPELPGGPASRGVGAVPHRDKPVVSSYAPHFGEEDPLVGPTGSGTIFFTHCNLYCIFCQNYEISHGGEGEEISVEDLAAMMLRSPEAGLPQYQFRHPQPPGLPDPGGAAGGHRRRPQRSPGLQHRGL